MTPGPPGLRPATPADAARLAALSVAGERRAGDGEGPAAVHHLDLPHGDDYFCLVAEAAEGTVVAYVSAGGSRDGDRKSWAELYELVTDPVLTRDDADRAANALVAAVVDRARDAQFGGLLAWTATAATEDLIAPFGFRFDPPPGGARAARRFGVELAPAGRFG